MKSRKWLKRWLSFLLMVIMVGNMLSMEGGIKGKVFAENLVTEVDGCVKIERENYTINVDLDGFRYGFYKADGTVIAQKHTESGISFAPAGEVPAEVVSAIYMGMVENTIKFQVVNENNQKAQVNIELFDHYVRFEIIPEASKTDEEEEITSNLPKVLWADAQDNWVDVQNPNTTLLGKAGSNTLDSTVRMLDIATKNQYVMEADVKIPSSGSRSIGLFVNYEGPKEIDCFFIKAGSSGNIGFKNISDIKGTTELAPTASYMVNKDQWYRMKMIVNGKNIKCYINETLIYDVNKSSVGSGTCGIRFDKMDCFIDNIRVYDDTYVYYENSFENTTVDEVDKEFQTVLGTNSAELVTYAPSPIALEGFLKLNGNPAAQAIVGTIDQEMNHVSADIMFASGDEETSATLLFGYQDENNYCGFGFSQAQTDKAILYQVSNGEKTTLGTADCNYGFDTKYSLGVEISEGKMIATVTGSSIVASVSGSSISVENKETITGQIGVRGTVTTIKADNVKVETTDGTNTYSFTNGDSTGWTLTDNLVQVVYGSDGQTPKLGTVEEDNVTKYVIDARVEGINPLYGLGDYGAYNNSGGVRATTNVSGTERTTEGSFTNMSDGKRFISNFTIAPSRGFAQVLFEEGEKRVSLNETQTMLGALKVEKVSKLYYFFGSLEEIYQDYRDVRNEEGYDDTKPHYDIFGLGWEAFGALGWNAYQSSVVSTVQDYLDAGYDITWAVIGSGFWPGDRSGLEGTTTSFGMWDNVASDTVRQDGLENPRFKDPDGMKNFFSNNGIKLLLGIRNHFKLPVEYGGKWDPSVDGNLVLKGLEDGYFIKNDDGSLFTVAKAKYPTGNITRGNVSLLDGDNAEAVNWFTECAALWGVDGFKEDAMISQSTNHDGNWNRILSNMIDQDDSLMIMRNGAYSLSGDVLRINDANYGTSNGSFNNSPDRMPINLLSYAASGVSNVYPDIVGGTGGNINDANYQKYVVRNAIFDALTPSISVGINVLNMNNEEYKNASFNAINWHSTYAPYIYDAALKSWETGYPVSMTPLYIAYPDDENTYEMASSEKRQYEWLLGESILATPLFGTDFLTTDKRDVYLPEGTWIDYETGETLNGPLMIDDREIPVDQMPIYIGGKGILVGEDMDNKDNYFVEVFPVADKGTTYDYTWINGTTTSTITNNADGWTTATLKVIDKTTDKEVDYTFNSTNTSIRFAYEADHDYEVVGGEGNGAVATVLLQTDKTTVSTKQKITLTLESKNDKKELISADQLNVTYVSSNSEVIDINESGDVTIGKNGTAKIYANVVRKKDEGVYSAVKSNEITITVTNPSVNYESPISYFEDDFESGTLDGWSDLTADYVIQDDGSGNNELYYKNSSAAARGTMVVGDNSWTDYVLETDITLDKIIPGKTVGLTARYAEYASCYLLAWTAGTGIRYIKRNLSTGTVEQQTVPYDMIEGQTYHYKMEALGDTLTLWIDGVKIITVQDKAFTNPVIAKGSCGLYSNGMTAIFDNVMVRRSISEWPIELTGTAEATDKISIEIQSEDGNKVETLDEVEVNTDGSWEYPIYYLEQGNHLCRVSIMNETGNIISEDSEIIMVSNPGEAPDKTKLQTAISAAKKVDSSKCTIEVANAFLNTLFYTEKLYWKQVTQVTIDKATEDLLSAIATTYVNEEETGNDPEDDDNTPPDDTGGVVIPPNDDEPVITPPADTGGTVNPPKDDEPVVTPPTDTEETVVLPNDDETAVTPPIVTRGTVITLNKDVTTGEVVAIVKPRTEITVTSGKAFVSLDLDSVKVVEEAKDAGATQKNPLQMQIQIMSDKILEQIKDVNIKTIQVSVEIPNTLTTSTIVVLNSLILDKEILDSCKTYNKAISVSIMNEGKEITKWTISTAELMKVKNDFTDINLLVEVVAASKLPEVKKILKADANNSKGMVVRMSQTGKLGVTSMLNIYIGEQQSIKPLSKVYLYRYNSKTSKLLSLKSGTAIVDVDGYVAFNLVTGTDYVILPKEANKKVVTSLINQVSASISSNTIKVGNSANIIIAFPDCMEKVNDFTSETLSGLSSAVLAAKVTYSSSNKDVATIKDGKVTAKKKGTTDITVVVTGKDGKKITSVFHEIVK